MADTEQQQLSEEQENAKQLCQQFQILAKSERRKFTHEDFAVGDLIMKGEHRAFVRYIGPVATSKKQTTMWLGLEWDDKTRGTNDGSVTKNGETFRYFECEQGRGGFIKPSKAEKGNTFCKQYAVKYDPEYMEQALEEQMRIAEETDFKFHFVGFDGCFRKLSKNWHLHEVHMYCDPVTEIDAPEVIGAFFPRTKCIMCVRTALRSWETIPNFDGLAELFSLDLSNNYLDPSTFNDALFTGKFQSMTILKLQTVNNSWEMAYRMRLQGCFPELKELDLQFCKLPNLEVQGRELNPAEVAENFPCLEKLQLSVNNIPEWRMFQIFKDCPVLESLQAWRNPIRDWFYDGGFENLNMLYISDSQMMTWAEVRSLSYFPSLTSINVLRSPIALEIGEILITHILHSLCPPAKLINQMCTGNLAEADNVYWKFIMDTLLEEHNGKVPWETLNEDELEARFPRFLALKQTHVLVKKQRVKKKGMDTISVTFKSVDVETITMAEHTKKLPASIKIAHVKVLCKKFFGLAPANQLLLVAAGDGSNKRDLPVVMTEVQKSLRYYVTTDDCVVSMQRVS